MHPRRRITPAITLIAGAVILAGCGSSSNNSSSSSGGGGSGGGGQVGGSVSVWAVWSGTEQQDFQQVLQGFQSSTGVTANYSSKGDNLPTVLGTAVSGGSPPDVAILPQPGLLHDLVGKNALQPLDDVVGTALSNDYASVWKDLGTVNGKLYGLYFKAANKSTVWYNPKVFQQASISGAPQTYDDLLTDAKTLQASGVAPFSMCGGSGWTLTDWFENVYLRIAGKDKYNGLAQHTVKWTDQTVTDTFTQLAKIFGDPSLMLGGTQGAVSTPFPDCVNPVFAATPKAGIVYEGDFVGSTITTANPQAQPGTDFDFFPFPSINGSPPSVSGGGDVAVMLKDTPQARALIKYLEGKDAGSIWAHLGGFTSPNKNVDPSNYPNDIARRAAKALIDAGANVVFDASDQAPAAFGGTAGSGEWADLQNWVRNPTDISGIEAKLESDATAAYGH